MSSDPSKPGRHTNPANDDDPLQEIRRFEREAQASAGSSSFMLPATIFHRNQAELAAGTSPASHPPSSQISTPTQRRKASFSQTPQARTNHSSSPDSTIVVDTRPSISNRSTSTPNAATPATTLRSILRQPSEASGPVRGPDAPSIIPISAYRYHTDSRYPSTGSPSIPSARHTYAAQDIRPTTHNTWDKHCAHTAKCDGCNRNKFDVVQRCRTCNQFYCPSCIVRVNADPYNIHSYQAGQLDWELPSAKKGKKTPRKPAKPDSDTPSKPKTPKKFKTGSESPSSTKTSGARKIIPAKKISSTNPGAATTPTTPTSTPVARSVRPNHPLSQSTAREVQSDEADYIESPSHKPSRKRKAEARYTRPELAERYPHLFPDMDANAPLRVENAPMSRGSNDPFIGESGGRHQLGSSRPQPPPATSPDDAAFEARLDELQRTAWRFDEYVVALRNQGRRDEARALVLEASDMWRELQRRAEQ